MQSTADLPFLLEEGMEVAFVPPVLDAPRFARVASISQVSDQSAVVMFDGVSDLDTAEALVGCHCLVHRSEVTLVAPEPVDSGWDGWGVYDAREGYIGSVSGLEEMPGQTMLLVAAEGVFATQGAGDQDAAEVSARIILIPLVDAFVVSVNEQARRIDIDVPEGLLSL